MNIEINIFIVLKNYLKNLSERELPIYYIYIYIYIYIIDSLPKETAEIETGMAEKFSPGT
jgi:hypothetical protein